MYTPLEIRDSILRIDDRPYAGVLYQFGIKIRYK